MTDLEKPDRTAGLAPARIRQPNGPGESERPTRRAVERLRLVLPFLGRESVFLQAGGHDGQLIRAVAGHVRYVYGIAPPASAPAAAGLPANCDLLAADRASIPLADGRVSVAFSDMLLGSLGSDESVRHLREVVRVLVPGGVYVCRTPHHYAGPPGAGSSFRELAGRFGAAGFEHVGVRALLGGRPLPCPSWAVRAAEAALAVVPLRPRFGAITLVGWKDRCGRVRADLPAFTPLPA
jgi:hypothetical protein